MHVLSCIFWANVHDLPNCFNKLSLSLSFKLNCTTMYFNFLFFLLWWTVVLLNYKRSCLFIIHSLVVQCHGQHYTWQLFCIDTNWCCIKRNASILILHQWCVSGNQCTKQQSNLQECTALFTTDGSTMTGALLSYTGVFELWGRFDDVTENNRYDVDRQDCRSFIFKVTALVKRQIVLLNVTF